ncbi:MAG: hypothetical protein U0610_12435 [bacterium]
MTAFDLFITLDGNCLNGFEGLCGVARLRCDPDADRWEKQINSSKAWRVVTRPR